MGNTTKSGIALLITLLFNFIPSFSQTTIIGQVRDSIGVINSASLVLKDSLSKSIIAFTYSDKNGDYKLKTQNNRNFILEINSLGYSSETVPIKLAPNQSQLRVDVYMRSEAESLNEVVIQAEQPISVKKDTINFKTKYFVDGTEQTVEDLLKKIPGLNVDSEGTIKLGNQEIEKLMIDGDDLFERGYKILSKNMPAYPIEEVELLKNYSNNHLLKGVEESDKVALNLKLDEKSKRIWFGNLESSIGNDSFYQLKGNLMNFGKKINTTF